nr:tetratricopeptide repeat protein [Corynebacterium lactis]
MTHAHSHAHGHSHSHSHDGHRECSTPPPPPGTVDLEQMHLKAEAERKRKEEIARATSDQGEGLPPVVEVTAQNLEAEVVVRSEQVPVIVLVGAAGAADSLRLRTELEAMAREAELNWILAWVDADSQPQVARAFGVQALPTVVAVAMGSPIGMFAGEKTRDWLDQWVAQVMEATNGRLKGLPAGTRMAGAGAGEGAQPEAPTDFFGNPVPTSDPRLEQAEELLAEGNFDAALSLYDAMLKSEPANSGLKRAHANVAFFARAAKIDRTADPISLADAAPGDVAAALDAADVTMLVDDPAKALDRLLRLLPTVFGKDRESIKERLLEYLLLFDAADPVALDARRRMASALF